MTLLEQMEMVLDKLLILSMVIMIAAQAPPMQPNMDISYSEFGGS